MLAPRFNWSCQEPGCCVFVGGTEHHDIYMARCHENIYDPGVLLINDGGADYEFTDQKHFADFVESKGPYENEHEQGRLGMALTFVQCFFPTPERMAMDRIAKGEEL